MISLIDQANTATWFSTIRENNRSTSWASVTWGQEVNRIGSASMDDNGHCEDGSRREVLKTHPRWISQGGISGIFPDFTVTDENSQFKADVGFLNGAAGTDGVTFEIWAPHLVEEFNQRSKLLSVEKTYTKELIPIEVDLSFLKGMKIQLQLSVLAGNSSGKDWAIWANP